MVVQIIWRWRLRLLPSVKGAERGLTFEPYRTQPYRVATVRETPLTLSTSESASESSESAMPVFRRERCHVKHMLFFLFIIKSTFI